MLDKGHQMHRFVCSRCWTLGNRKAAVQLKGIQTFLYRPGTLKHAACRSSFHHSITTSVILIIAQLSQWIVLQSQLNINIESTEKYVDFFSNWFVFFKMCHESCSTNRRQPKEDLKFAACFSVTQVNTDAPVTTANDDVTSLKGKEINWRVSLFWQTASCWV